MINEQQEAADSVKEHEKRQLQAMDTNRENAESVTEVNRSLVRFHQARAELRLTFATCAKMGATLALAWSIWAMVRWA